MELFSLLRGSNNRFSIAIHVRRIRLPGTFYTIMKPTTVRCQRVIENASSTPLPPIC